MKKLKNYLQTLNNCTGHTIISPSKQKDADEAINDYIVTMAHLENNLNEFIIRTSYDKESIQKSIVNININLVDLMTDIDNIHSVFIEIVKDYSDYIDKSNIMKK